LIPWLNENIEPSDWIVELTGGEPALFKDIDRLCKWLSDNKYRTLVKTNGLLEIKSYPYVSRIAAFHNLDNPPKFFDIILIIDKLDREAKELYCNEHNWPYKVIGFNKENPDGAHHGFDKIAFIDPHGHNVPCPSCPILWKSGDDPYVIERKPLSKGHCCSKCKAAIDAWRFI
jgi:molybdenum cofactor biosynthesis enzyme MoaA